MPAVGDIYMYRLRTWCSQENGQLGLMIGHFTITGQAGTGGTELQFASALNGRFATPVTNVLSNLAGWYGPSVQRIRPTLGVEVPAIGTFPVAGTVAGGIAPMQCSVLMSLRSVVPGRHGHGRKYGPFIGMNNVGGNGTLTAGGLTDYNTLAALFAGTLPAVGIGPNTSDLQLVLYNRVAHTTIPITSAFAKSFIATQRSRGGWGRPNPPPI